MWLAAHKKRLHRISGWPTVGASRPEVFIGLQEVGEGDFVDDRAARAVNEHGVLLHHVEAVLVEQVERVAVQVAVQAHHLHSKHPEQHHALGHQWQAILTLVAIRSSAGGNEEEQPSFSSASDNLSILYKRQ